jgi:hypothetical protein
VHVEAGDGATRRLLSTLGSGRSRLVTDARACVHLPAPSSSRMRERHVYVSSSGCLCARAGLHVVRVRVRIVVWCSNMTAEMHARTHSRLLSLVDENPSATEYGDGSDDCGCKTGGGDRDDAAADNGERTGDQNQGCGNGADAGGIRGGVWEYRRRSEGRPQEHGEVGWGQEHGEEEGGGLGLRPGGEGVEEGGAEALGRDAELGKEAAIVTGAAEGASVSEGADGEAEAATAATATGISLGVMHTHAHTHSHISTHSFILTRSQNVEERSVY